jgi:excisionase family DNA binding protein
MNDTNLIRTFARYIAEEVVALSTPRKQAHRLLSPREAAEYLRVSPAQLHRLKSEGRIKAVQDRPKARVQYDVADLDRYIEVLKN